MISEKINPLKKYGQNFLTNTEIAKKIIDSLQISNDDVIMEIGPGKGALTGLILEKSPLKFYAFEIDPRMAQFLKKKFGDGVEVKLKDVLHFSATGLKLNKGQRIKVVGNIPYYITSPIIFKLLEEKKYIEKIVLMIQKEVADRLVAVPNNKIYGILSVMAASQAEVTKLFNVSKNNFYPVPKVDSAVIQMDFVEALEEISDLDLFRKIVHTVFNTRRKMLQNSLKRMLNENTIAKIQSVSLSLRPENLTVSDFKFLTDEISHLLKN